METVSQAASSSYYLGHMSSFRSPFHYYNGGDEPDGVWWNPSGLFGLEDGDDIEATAFQNLHSGRSPINGSALTRNADRPGRSPGLDITFSPDKSISALWAIADSELRSTIEQCHDDAVRWTLENVTRRHCAYTRRGAGGSQVVPGDILAATFRHHTSRENDPQLHTHCVIFNLVRTHDDGEWRALHQRPIYQWVRAGGAVYRHALAWNLRERLGIELERYGHEREFVRIAAIPEELVRTWSTRREAIEKLASKLGITTSETPALSQQITLATRPRKDVPDLEERHDVWREQAAPYIDREQLITELLANVPGRPKQEAVRELIQRCRELPARLTLDEAVFTFPQLIEHIARESPGLVAPQGLETILARVLRDNNIIALDQHRAGSSADAKAGLSHTRLFSTLDYAAEENTIQELALRSLSQAGYAVPSETIEQRLGELVETGYPIGEQQRAAVHHLAGTDTSLAVCLGAAGSGKTVALRPVADLYRERGYRVIASALSWRAAVNLGTECGIQPYSLARLFRQVRTGKTVLDDKTVLLLDEAGMLSVREMRTVLDLAERAGTKVLAIGDLDQLQPIEAGPGLRLVVDELGAAQIETIRRQRPDLEDLVAWQYDLTPDEARANAELLSKSEREALFARRDEHPGQGWQAEASESIRKGEAARAIEAYATRGRFFFGSNFEATLQRLANDWRNHTTDHPDASRLVIARTNREVRALSEVLRAYLHPPQIPRNSVTITTGRGEPGRRKTSNLEIAEGDLIRIGSTIWDKQLFNGTIVTVNQVGTVTEDGIERVRIEASTEDGRDVTFYADEAKDIHGNIRLDYGYALTIASAQGSTADRVFFLTDDRPARETAYPALTRHRDRLDIYIDTEPLALTVRQYRSEEDWDKPVTHEELYAHLARSWSREGAKEAARDYASPGQREEIAARVAAADARRSARHLTETLRGLQLPDRPEAPEPSTEDLNQRVFARLRARGGAFSRAGLRRLLWAEGVEPRVLDETAAAVLADPNIMQLYGADTTAREPLYTTTETYAAEEQLTRLAARLHARSPDTAPPHPRHIERAVRVLDPATADLARSLVTGSPFTVVAASADRQRGAALEAAIAAYSRAGSHVLACGASRRSLDAYGRAVTERRTVHGLLARISRGDPLLARTSVLLVNDAQALDTDTLYTLTRLTDEAGVRLVLVGDPRTQCRSPAFRWLSEHCGRNEIECSAPDHLPERDRQVLAGELDTRALLDHLEDSGSLRRVEPEDELVPSVIDAWTAREAADPGSTQLVIASDPARAAELNATIQSARAAAGRLGSAEQFDVLRPGVTDPEKRSSTAAASRQTDLLDSIQVHVGDRLRILENEPRSGLCRGDVGTVLSVSRRRIRILVDGKERSFHPRRHNRFTLGYATTVYQQHGTADHVHAIVSASSNRPGVFRAVSAHEKSLTLHWAARAGETVTDLASAIDAKGPVECSQHYVDRQRALHDAHIDNAAANELRTAWHLLSEDERRAIEDQDRKHLASIHEQQRPRDRANPWLRTAEPASIATAFGHVARYRTERAAAVAYQHRYGELVAELAETATAQDLDVAPSADDTRRMDLLEELHDLTTAATDRAAQSSTFRLVLVEKTTFTPEDLERHRAECEHELRARRLQEEALDSEAHFEAHAAAWCLDAADVLQEGGDLAAAAKLGEIRPWFAEDYSVWHRSLVELATRRETLAEARSALPDDATGLVKVLHDFDAAGDKITAALNYHQREERTAARARSYREFSEALTERYVEFYENTEGRSGPDQVTYERRLNEDHKLLYERAAELAQDLEWALPHLEEHGIKEREIQQYAEAHQRSADRPAQSIDIQRTH